MESDFDLGSTLRDDIIPLALEYYLGVIDQESEGSDGDFEDEDDSIDQQEPNDDDEDDGKPAKKKGGKKAAPTEE